MATGKKWNPQDGCDLRGGSAIAGRSGDRLAGRNGGTKVGRAVFVPGEGLHVDLAAPAGTAAAGGVIDDPVFLAVGRFHKGAVAGAKHRFGAGEDWIGFLDPRSGCERIAASPGELAEAVVVSPASAGGVNDEKVRAVPEGLRSFVDGDGGPEFPRLVRAGDAHALAGDGQRIGHGGEVEALFAIDQPGPTGPDEEEASVRHFEDGAVDGPAIGFGGDLAFEVEGILRVLGGALQDVHAVVFVLSIIGREVDVPIAPQVAELRRPDIAAVFAVGRGSPDVRPVVLADLQQAFEPVDPNRLAAPGLGEVILPFVLDDPGIGARENDRIDDGARRERIGQKRQRARKEEAEADRMENGFHKRSYSSSAGGGRQARAQLDLVRGKVTP